MNKTTNSETEYEGLVTSNAVLGDTELKYYLSP